MPQKSKRTFQKYDPEQDLLNYDFSYNDEETAALHQVMNNNADVDINDLRRISLWKIDRVLDIGEGTIEKIRELARMENVTVKDPFVKDILEELVSSQGVGFPMASAILKFVKPEVFPIIDVRAYRALTGKKPYYAMYSYDMYVDYAQQLKVNADRLGVPISAMDEQLYCFDKRYNGKL